MRYQQGIRRNLRYVASVGSVGGIATDWPGFAEAGRAGEAGSLASLAPGGGGGRSAMAPLVVVRLKYEADHRAMAGAESGGPSPGALVR